MDREIEIRKRRGTRVLLTVLALWGLAVAVAAQAGVYRAIYPLLLAPIIALGIVVPVVAYAMSKGFRAYIEAIGLRPLTAFHIWRIAAASLFFWYGAHDLLPQVFVQSAGWGDLIAGLWPSASRRCPKAALDTWSPTSSGSPILSWPWAPG